MFVKPWKPELAKVTVGVHTSCHIPHASLSPQKWLKCSGKKFNPSLNCSEKSPARSKFSQTLWFLFGENFYLKVADKRPKIGILEKSKKLIGFHLVTIEVNDWVNLVPYRSLKHYQIVLLINHLQSHSVSRKI